MIDLESVQQTVRDNWSVGQCGFNWRMATRADAVRRAALPELTRAGCPGLEFLRSLAFHESGHAVIALSVNVPVAYASIQAVPPNTSGRMLPAVPNSEIPARAYLLFTAAGPAAQRRYFRAPWEFDELASARCDYGDLPDMRAKLAEVHKVEPLSDLVTEEMQQWHARADQAVTRHWRWIEAVAEELFIRRRLTGAQIEALRP